MNPIAVVHWVDKLGNEYGQRCYDQDTLERISRTVRQQNYLSWTCMCSGDAAIPMIPPKRHIRGA